MSLHAGGLPIPLVASGGTVTTSQPLLDLSQTWNNVATTFTGMKLNVTDTASATASNLFDLQVGGVSAFAVRKDGTTTSTGSVITSVNLRSKSNSGVVSIGASDDVVLARDAANTLALRNGTNAQRSKAFNTYTDASNGEWFDLDWITTANVLRLGTNKNGTGTSRGIQFIIGGSGVWDISASGHLQADQDLTFKIGDIGANRPILVSTGSFAAQISSQSGTTYTVAASDHSLIFTSGTAVTLTLPAAASFGGRILHLKQTGAGAVSSASSNVVPLAGGAAGTAILTAAAKWAQLQSDGTSWIIMAAN